MICQEIIANCRQEKNDFMAEFKPDSELTYLCRER